MTTDEFIQNVINTWGDWKENKTRGESKVSADFKKNRFIKAVEERYTDYERALLWDLVEEKCKYRPSVNALTSLMAGRVTRESRFTPGYDFTRSTFGFENEYTTDTGRWLGEQFQDFFVQKQYDRRGSLVGLTQEDEMKLIIRSGVFWRRIDERLKKVPEEIKKKVFHPFRCGGCGRRVYAEMQAGEFYCRECGWNIKAPGGLFQDAGGGAVGEQIGAKLSSVVQTPVKE
jgi:ribosomal protein L37AE/L43A